MNDYPNGHTHSRKDTHMRHQGEPGSNDYFCMKCAKVVELDG